MIKKELLIYLFIIAFFLSFNRYDTPIIGLVNLFFAFISTTIGYILVLYTYRLVSSYYGLIVDFSLIEAEKEIKKYDYSKKDIISHKRKINISYILTLLLGFLSAGYFIPIVLSLNTVVVESKRLGKAKSLDVSFEEKTKIIFIGTLTFWVIFSSIKYLASLSVLLEGVTDYLFRFLFYYTISSILPITLVLIPIVVEKMGYSFKSISIGDNFIYTKKPFLIASSITLIFLPIFSIIFDPILVIILSLVVYSIIWLRKYVETI